MLKLFKGAASPAIKQEKQRIHDALSYAFSGLNTIFDIPLIVYPIDTEKNAVVVSVGGQNGYHFVTDFKFSISIDKYGGYQSHVFNNTEQRWESAGESTNLNDAFADMLIGIDNFNQMDRAWKHHQKPWVESNTSDVSDTPSSAQAVPALKVS